MSVIPFRCVVLPIILAVPALAAQPVTETSRTADTRPWEWTSVQRVAVRTDPATVRRLLIVPSIAESEFGATGGNRRFLLRIEGRTHPELLLPIELFRNLLSGLRGRPEGVAILREAYAPIVARLRLPPNLLRELVVIASEYVEREERIQTLNERLTTTRGRDAATLRSERDALSPLQCSTLFEALTTARARYGGILFDRFLYEAVAPGMVVTMDEPDDAAQLLQWDRGCR
jgi:hypothetical protein